MLSEEKYEKLYEKAKLMYEQHKSFSDIEAFLMKECNDLTSKTEILKQLKTIHYATKRKRGSLIILTGSVFLLVGFLLTVSNFYANTSIAYVMYGFTTVGLLIIFIGLFDVLG